MSKMATVLAFLVATGCLAGVAHAQAGVDFETFESGGIQWTTSMPALNSLLAYGQRLSDGYDVPVASTLRAGCFVATPWFEVTHGDGIGEHFPDFYATWQGVLFPLSTTNANANVFTIRVEVQRPDGSVTETRKTVTTSQFALVPIFIPMPGSVFSWGDFDNEALSLSVAQGYNVHVHDHVRASVCDLAPLATIKVRHLVVRTFPNILPPPSPGGG
jgi:hypothetical protein